MIRAGIVGATGYAGAELVRILSGHPGVELTILTSRQYAGVPFENVYPSMGRMTDLKCQKFELNEVCGKTDVVFISLPHQLPMEIVPSLMEKQKKVIDLSADFRFKDAATYESFYQPHTAVDLLKKAVYGLSEVYTEEIAAADLVGNPGCYPTSTLLPLIPLLRSGFIDTRTIVVDSKSGVSGAGRSLSLKTHFCEVNESLKAYNVTRHRHKPEMEEVLGIEAGEPVRITFVPHLVPMTRGMLTTIYVTVNENVGIEDIHRCIYSAYSKSPFVRIMGDRQPPDTLYVRGTNFCDIGFSLDHSNHRLIVMSAIDNLVKGAAGQAVQNMNIMFGMDTRAGLLQVPFSL